MDFEGDISVSGDNAGFARGVSYYPQIVVCAWYRRGSVLRLPPALLPFLVLPLVFEIRGVAVRPHLRREILGRIQVDIRPILGESGQGK